MKAENQPKNQIQFTYIKTPYMHNQDCHFLLSFFKPTNFTEK